MALSRNTRNTLTALAFLAPNIFGFMALTVFPLVLSLFMAFTNWDLTLHNRFQEAPLRFVWLDNFIRMVTEPDFWRFLVNTLFFMIRIPFSIAGSLLLALLLTRKLRAAGKTRLLTLLIIPAVTALGIGLLSAAGAGPAGMTLLMILLVAGVLLGGIAGGSVLYRTLFFLPSFTAGAAVFILWTKLYNPNTGPINNALRGPLLGLTATVQALGPGAVSLVGLALAGLGGLVGLGLIRRLGRLWREGDVGTAACLIPTAMLLLPAAVVLMVSPAGALLNWLLAGFLGLAAAVLALSFGRARPFRCAPGYGSGSALMLAGGGMVLIWVLLGLAVVVLRLPGMVASEPLQPPTWLADYHWAKPAIMLMGFWITMGSNNMLLYIAGLSNIPPELYEAADIDGASSWQRFWNVTWPQLAPTTFFIVIMSVIVGLKAGFEQARVMTGGGPDGATTTLSYYIYTEGFEIGRLGYASAVAWTLFLMIFLVTVFNWRFGNRYVND